MHLNASLLTVAILALSLAAASPLPRVNAMRLPVVPERVNAMKTPIADNSPSRVNAMRVSETLEDCLGRRDAYPVARVNAMRLPVVPERVNAMKTPIVEVTPSRVNAMKVPVAPEEAAGRRV